MRVVRTRSCACAHACVYRRVCECVHVQLCIAVDMNVSMCVAVCVRGRDDYVMSACTCTRVTSWRVNIA